MSNTTFRNTLRFTDGLKHVSIADSTGTETETSIVDASGNLVAPLVITEPNKYSNGTGITAGTTQTQAGATALTEEFNNVTTCGTDGDGVKLPTAVAGLSIRVKNSGATTLAVYPNTSDSINALAVNLAINVPVGGLVTFNAISATVWETEEVLVSTAPTTQKGELVVKAVDNAADHQVTLSNASHGQASTHTIPDPGGATGTIVLEEIANVFDVPQRYDANTTITAFAGGGQGSATALTGEFNNVTTCATADDSVALPAAAGGLCVTVKNSGAASLAVFPASGDSINALAVNLSVNIPVGGMVTFRAIDGTVWETQEVLTSHAPTTQKGELVVKAVDNDADTATTISNAAMGQASVISIPDPGAATANFLLTDAANDQTLVTATATELNYLDIATLGTGAASKAVVLDAGDDYTWPDAGVLTLGNIATAAESAEHGAGAIGTGVAPVTYRWIEHGVIITQIKIDLEGLASVATVNDVIGLSAGGNAYIGQNVVATNGVIYAMELACVETPVGGDNDVNVVVNSSGTLAYDGAGGTTYGIDGGDAVAGQVISNTVQGLTANHYFYLTAGTGDTAAAYTAGQFILTMYGHPVLT